MLEDVLGWVVGLVGAVVMRFSNFALIDPIMSIGVSLFIFINAIKNLKEVAYLFLEKTPHNIDVTEIKEHIAKIDGIIDVHHIHVWSLDMHNNFATMHIVTDDEPHKIKDALRDELREHGVGHVTIEIETSFELCREKTCHLEFDTNSTHEHHHSH